MVAYREYATLVPNLLPDFLQGNCLLDNQTAFFLKQLVEANAKEANYVLIGFQLNHNVQTPRFKVAKVEYWDVINRRSIINTVVLSMPSTLPIIHIRGCAGQTYLLFIEQLRTPLGQRFLECPTGLLNLSQNGICETEEEALLRECYEETGIAFKHCKILQHGPCCMYPSVSNERLGVGLIMATPEESAYILERSETQGNGVLFMAAENQVLDTGEPINKNLWLLDKEHYVYPSLLAMMQWGKPFFRDDTYSSLFLSGHTSFALLSLYFLEHYRPTFLH